MRLVVHDLMALPGQARASGEHRCAVRTAFAPGERTDEAGTEPSGDRLVGVGLDFLQTEQIDVERRDAIEQQSATLAGLERCGWRAAVALGSNIGVREDVVGRGREFRI